MGVGVDQVGWAVRTRDETLNAEACAGRDGLVVRTVNAPPLLIVCRVIEHHLCSTPNCFSWCSRILIDGSNAGGRCDNHQGVQCVSKYLTKHPDSGYHRRCK